MRRGFAATLVLALAGAARAEEATYVVSVPPGYSAERTWPLIVDFHGAIAPSRKGAEITQERLWSLFVRDVDCVVVGINGRTRAWGMLPDDKAEALRILAEVRAKYAIDPARIYLAGFSSGSDFLCRSNLQLEGPFAGSLVTCPGPPNVVGLRDGELLRAKAHPFYFATGEEDYVRKEGAWQAFVAVDAAGGRAMYREVPGVGHDFFPVDEYARMLDYLRTGNADAEEAFRRGDFLLASTHGTPGLKERIEARGRALLDEAAQIDDVLDAGRAYEAWWRIRTQFHRFEAIAARAREELDALEKRVERRELYRARRQWFRTRTPIRGFNRYLPYDEVEAFLRGLPGEVTSIGKSVEGRDIWAIGIGKRENPAVFVMGGLHGNEASSVMAALYIAWQFGENPAGLRTVDGVRERTALYVVPVANPDAYHHYLAEPFSHWRPRFNYRPHDSDGDGRVDEDDVEDLDGDGEIGLMYRPDPAGRYEFEGKTWTLVGYEGIDNDGDGSFNEDPKGGVDLNRNFPVGWSPRAQWKGFSGPEALSEPETRAVTAFVGARDNIALFLDIHNAAACLFWWRGGGLDDALYEGLAERSRLAPKPLDHAGAGLSAAWAYGALGRPACILELPPGGWDETIPLRPFKHPQLGDILVGNEATKLSKRNPKPDAITALVDPVWRFVLGEMERLPRLELVDPRVVGDTVTGEVRNAGEYPTDTARALKLGAAAPVRAGDVDVGTLAPGESRPFRAPVTGAELIVRHPRAGSVRLATARERTPVVPVRRDYTVAPGYATPDRAATVALETDNGPAFALAHGDDELRIAVLLGEWKDRRHSYPPDAFEQAFFGERDSVREFYREMSYGRMEITGKVFDWVEFDGGYETYRDASFGSPIVQMELRKAVLARYGADALDGFDAFAFVWAGNPVRRTSALWPMRLTGIGKAAFKMGEFYRGEFSPIGVPCHEIGHTFGVSDKYGLGATRNPLGPWCLMGKGTHGGGTSGPHRPFPMCAWCRMVIGWVKPAVIDPATPRKLALRPISFGPGECFRILLKPDGSEYLLLENRRREGYLTELPSAGLAVLRVGPNDAPAYPQTRVQLLPAHGLPPAERGVVASPGAVAWTEGELTVDGVRIVDIRIEDDVAYFVVGR